MTEYPADDVSRSQQGKGMHLRSGLRLQFADFKPTETMRLPVEIHAGWLRFTFLCEGKWHMDWRTSSGTAVSNKRLSLDRGSLVSFSPGLEGTACFPAGQRQSHLSILISQPLMSTLIDQRFQRIPPELQAIIDGCHTIDFFHHGPLSPVMNAVTQAILHCPYSGALGLIYRESKVFELIAHKLAQIESANKVAPAPVNLRKEDIERVRCAKAILSRDLENPPRLFDLARAVGTSHPQLNRAFQRIYGTSVFGYLRQMRLEMARHLLEKGDMNVTEAAFAVGYNSLSSFSRAFSAHFGLKPLRFLRTCLKTPDQAPPFI